MNKKLFTVAVGGIHFGSAFLPGEMQSVFHRAVNGADVGDVIAVTDKRSGLPEVKSWRKMADGKLTAVGGDFAGVSVDFDPINPLETR